MMDMQVPDDRKICIGLIAGAHGVRGDVRLRSFTEEPENIKRYKPITDEAGARTFTIKLKGATNDFFIAAIDGVKDRDTAEALRGTKLYAPRSALPKLKKREFYEADLIGIAARDVNGADAGMVVAVHNYGGGPFLEIAPSERKTYMLPFDRACVPQVNIEEGYIVIAPPKGWLE